MDNTLTKYRTFLICIALAVVTITVFYQVCSYEFINYDDPRDVFDNPNIKNSLNLEAIKWAFTTSYADIWHPLTWLTHMLAWQIYGSNAGGHHLFNLILHVANTLLVFIVLKKMTGAIWQSTFAAALFAIHPLHVQSVAWVTERKDVLSTFFMMLTIWAYYSYVNKPKVGKYILIMVFFALGLMSKAMLVTLPFVLLLLDYWPLDRFWTSGQQKGKIRPRSLSYLLIEKIPLFLMIVPICIITYLFQKKGGSVQTIEYFAFPYRIANASIAYASYILKMFWPAKLAFFYPHAGWDTSIQYAVLSFVVLLVITILVIRFSKNHRYLLTGWFWYLGTLVPVIGLVQVGSQAMADRYSYITLTGLFIIIAWGIPQLLKNWSYRKAFLWCSSLIILLALSVWSYMQQKPWKNALTLCEHALKVTKENFDAHYYYYKALIRKQIRNQDIIYHCLEALKIDPQNPEVLYDLGSTLYQTGRINEAISHYEKALEYQPSRGQASNNAGEVNANLGVAYLAKDDFKKAIEQYRIALEEIEKAVKNKKQPLTPLKLNRLYEASSGFREILSKSPDDPKVLYELGFALMQSGAFDQALKCFKESLKLNADNPEAHYYSGRILLIIKGDGSRIVTHFEQALALKPDWAEPMNDLAWFLAAGRDKSISNPTKALSLAKRACELTYNKNPEFLDTLSVAYAATGDFDNAVMIAEKAIHLCTQFEQQAIKEQIKKRLDLYKAGKTFIEP